MPDPDRLTLANPAEVADALAFALAHVGRKRVHDAGEFIAAIVAADIVDALDRAGLVVMQRPPIGGASAVGRGFEPG